MCDTLSNLIESDDLEAILSLLSQGDVNMFEVSKALENYPVTNRTSKRLYYRHRMDLNGYSESLEYIDMCEELPEKYGRENAGEVMIECLKRAILRDYTEITRYLVKEKKLYKHSKWSEVILLCTLAQTPSAKWVISSPYSGRK